MSGSAPRRRIFLCVACVCGSRIERDQRRSVMIHGRSFNASGNGQLKQVSRRQRGHRDGRLRLERRNHVQECCSFMQWRSYLYTSGEREQINWPVSWLLERCPITRLSNQPLIRLLVKLTGTISGDCLLETHAGSLFPLAKGKLYEE